MRTSIVTLFGCVALLGLAGQAMAQEGARITLSGSEGYAQRPLTLPRGRMRVDLAPPDFAYMDHGMINGRRGLRVLVPDAGDAQVRLGMGAAFGVLDELEVGGLLLPLNLSPDFDYGDMEIYGRYAFLRGRYDLAGQLTLHVPSDTDFGLGLGVPLLIEIGDAMRFDGGAELEVLFADDALVNLDIPAALSFEIAEIAFVGARTGAFILDFSDLDINLGIQGGVTIKNIVDITASFNWPLFISTRDYVDAFNLDWFELTFGATLYFDLYRA